MKNRKDQGTKTHRIGGERRADDVLCIAGALKRRGRISLRVHGTSMQPWVRPKDIAMIRQISIENVRCGDVVLFRRQNRLLVHRIVKKRGSLNASQLFSKGDAHPTSDGVVQEQELLGRVMRIYQRKLDAFPHWVDPFRAYANFVAKVPFELAGFCAAASARPGGSAAAATLQGHDGVISFTNSTSRAREFLERPDGQQAFHEDLEKFHKTAVLLHGND